MLYLIYHPDYQHRGLCIPGENEEHVNDSPVSIWNIKEPSKSTITLAGTTSMPAQKDRFGVNVLKKAD